MLISDLPLRLQEMCFANQRNQGNPTPFTGDIDADSDAGNFLWADSIEGGDFWDNLYNTEEIPEQYKNDNYDIY